MQGLNVALASVPGLKHANPELVPLIDCTLQLFENAPDSVFMFYDELIAAYAAQDMNIDLNFSVSDWMDEQNPSAPASFSEKDPSFPDNFPPSGPTIEQPAVRIGTLVSPDTMQLPNQDDDLALAELIEHASEPEPSKIPTFRQSETPTAKKRNKTMFFGGDLLSEEEVHQRIQSANIDRNNESIHCIKTPLPTSFSSQTPVPKSLQSKPIQTHTPIPAAVRAPDARFEKQNDRSLVSESVNSHDLFGTPAHAGMSDIFELDFGSSNSPKIPGANLETAERHPIPGTPDKRFSFTPPPTGKSVRSSFDLDFEDSAREHPSAREQSGVREHPSRDIDFASLSNSSLNIFEDKPAQDNAFSKSIPPAQKPGNKRIPSRNLAAIMSDFDATPRSTIPSLSSLSSSAHLHSLKRADLSGLGRDLSKVGDPNERSNIGRAQSDSDKRPTKPSMSPVFPPANPMEPDIGPLDRLAPLTRTPSLTCKLSEIITRKDISSRAGFIISMIDGITSLQDIIDLSAWSAEETATILLELERMHIIAF